MLAALIVLLVVALPNTSLAWLRSEIRWLGRAVNWVEHLWPNWNTVHIVLFAALGILARLAAPGAPLGRLMAGLVLFAAASELLQFGAPGRTPRLADFAQDVLGAALGVALVMGVVFVWRRMGPGQAAPGNR